jgi:hypothetical protein
MGFLDRMVFRGQTSSVKKNKNIQREREAWEREHSAPGQEAGQPAGQEVLAKTRLFGEAEALRKAGRVREAELKYLESIEEEEKEGPKAPWRQTGPAPSKYEALAKLYYYTNRDDLALGIMDKYLSYCEDCGKDDVQMKRLRESMANGSFKRKLIRGWAYSADDSRDDQAM